MIPSKMGWARKDGDDGAAVGVVGLSSMLGLAVATEDAWVRAALADLDAFIVDHAHCELKAATNAMSLVARFPDETELVLALTALAAEELEHFRQVMEHVAARKLLLGKPQDDPYAAALRNASAQMPLRHDPRYVLVDRLLVGALIEARSCERFKLLSRALTARESPGDATLAAFYDELMRCEARHYRTYVDLAKLAAREFAHEVDARLAELTRRESQLLRKPTQISPTVHG
jgi:tRNA 2-(methylsulfanyl)-N6-isopentenyladenosine37 hydroxylase